MPVPGQRGLIPSAQVAQNLMPSVRLAQRPVPSIQIGQRRLASVSKAQAISQAIALARSISVNGPMQRLIDGRAELLARNNWSLRLSYFEDDAGLEDIQDYRLMFEELQRISFPPEESLRSLLNMIASDTAESLRYFNIVASEISAAVAFEDERLSSMGAPVAAPSEFTTKGWNSRDRLLLGNFTYCIVLSIMLLAFLSIMGESEIDREMFSTLTFITGIGAHQIARLTRTAAFRAYDSMYTPS
jgi:hypothetical protein